MPDNVELSIGPTIALALLPLLIVEVIAITTDKAELLNRLTDD